MARSQYDLFVAIDGMSNSQMVRALMDSGEVDSYTEGYHFLEDSGMLKDDDSLVAYILQEKEGVS